MHYYKDTKLLDMFLKSFLHFNNLTLNKKVGGSQILFTGNYTLKLGLGEWTALIITFRDRNDMGQLYHI